MNAKTREHVVLPPAMGIYCYLFQPSPPPLGSPGKPSYRIELLYEKARRAELEPLVAAAVRVAEAKWPGHGRDIVKNMKHPLLRDGDQKEAALYHGRIAVRAKTNADPNRAPPRVVDGRRQPVLSPDEAYSGCTFRVSVDLVPYDHPLGGKGIGVYLVNAQVVMKGERLDGKAQPEDDFDEVEGGAAGGAADDLLGI